MSSRVPTRVCIITQELYAWSEPTETAAAILGLAQQLARRGDTVTLVWIAPFEAEHRPNATDAQKLQDYYFSNYLIRLEIISTSKDVYPTLYNNQMASAEIYYFLKDQEFDVAYFALEGGLAYYPLMAKELGLFKSAPPIYLLCHTPFVWKAEADRQFIENTRQLTIIHMEKYCVAAADLVISPSAFMLQWMRDRDWDVPNAVVLPDFRPYEYISEDGRNANSGPLTEIAFFAGPDYRYGLTLFCDALDKLARLPLPKLTVTFLGRYGRILGEHTGAMLLRRGRHWPFEIRMFPRLTEREAIDYVKNRHCLAVVPSLAANAPLVVTTCIEEGIPFVASDVGGTSELIAPPDRKALLCEPTPKSLGDKIAATLRAPPKLSKLVTVDKQNAWDKHQSNVRKSSVASSGEKHEHTPLVSIIMVHHDRPQYLLQAVKAVERQDYPNFELILVDDGSIESESQALLDKLQPVFEKRGWRMIRQENRYLGAARNAGIRIARGARILFVDDDNALFDHAVSTFVSCMTQSGADVCTAFYRSFHDPHLPNSNAHGHINYLPLGGSIDLALINNPFGDANAMIRREVFDKIGYQIEDYGYTAQDWEFFTRAALAGLKIRVIPEPLYWYRSRPEGMFRSSHWYANRLPIIAAFRKHNFAGLEFFYHLPIAQNVESGEKESLNYNLHYNVSDERMLTLRNFDPNSDEAIELIAECAAVEGRSETSITLLGHIQKPEFRKRALETLSVRSASDRALAELGGEFVAETVLNESQLREIQVRSSISGRSSPGYVESPDRFYMCAVSSSISVAVLAAGCPVGTISASTIVFQDQAIASPTEFLIMLAPIGIDPITAIKRLSDTDTVSSSGWCVTTRPFEVRKIEAHLHTPSREPLNLILGVRAKNRKRTSKKVLGCFSYIVLRQSMNNIAARRPRLGLPPNTQRAREIDRKALRSAKLVTNYESQRPILLFPPNEEGIFLRPSAKGNVVATLPWQFPPFAKKLVGIVEIAHEEASPFEFAMALTRPEATVEWADEVPVNCLAFSGWVKVEEKFEFRKLVLEMKSLVMHPLSINLAIRLPKGSKPHPSNACWRKLVLAWDE